jgi:hypothetical protein
MSNTKEKLKIYISGPMTGYKDYNYPKFEKIADKLRKKGYDVVNPSSEVKPMLSNGKEVTVDELHEMINNGEISEKEAWRCFLRGDVVALMIKCNAIYMLKNWKNSKGARMERTNAKRMDFEYFEEGHSQIDLL